MQIKPYVWCDRNNNWISNEVCFYNIINHICTCKRGGRKSKIMAPKSRLKKFLDELNMPYDSTNTKEELIEKVIWRVTRIKHADNLSPELRKALLDDYQFEIVDKDGNKLDHFLEKKK